MNNRYVDAPDSVKSLVTTITQETFPVFVEADIDVIYNMKKKLSGGNLVIGEMKKSNELIRHYTEKVNSVSANGADYVMILDGTVFPLLEKDDQIRIIRHELSHCEFDGEAKKGKNPWKTRPHEIEDFHAEIIHNSGDPRWKERVMTIAFDIYEAEEME